MPADGKIFSVTVPGGASTVIGNEDIRPFKEMYFGKSPLILHGMIKFKSEASSVIRVNAVQRLVAKTYPGTTTSTKIVVDSAAMAENLLKVDKATDGLSGGYEVESLDQHLYSKMGEVRARVTASLMQITNDVAELRYLKAFKTQNVTDKATQQIIISEADLMDDTKNREVLKKISDPLSKMVASVNKYGTTIPRNIIKIFATPYFVARLRALFLLGVRQPTSFLNDHITVGDQDQLMVDGVKVIEAPKMIGRNSVAKDWHVSETLDMSKYHAIITTERAIDSFIWGIHMKEEVIPGTAGNIGNYIKAMTKSQVFQEFKGELWGIVKEQVTA